MNLDPGILCFNHCGCQVFCLELPEICPVCRKHLNESETIVPFRVPYPFVRAKQYPCSVLLKPTNGDFLNNFRISQDLHIGVTTSKGIVIEFDNGGLRKDRTESWSQCLLVNQLEDDAWKSHWDDTLEEMAQQNCWTPEKYNEDTFNCYTFVLFFVRCLHYSNMSSAAASREKFCSTFVTPRTIIACKYIALYRQLKDFGYHVVHDPRTDKVTALLLPSK
nr:PREDICTED: MKRN2 opposite strand protein [Bemisia tabaci]XP_018902597.1 PREDICTED: MKRN2 opposite strand protein [Bemisia tabaci]